MDKKQEIMVGSSAGRGRALLYLLIACACLGCSIVSDLIACLLFGAAAAVFICGSLLRFAPQRSAWIFAFVLLTFALAVGVAFLFTLLPEHLSHGVFNYCVVLLPLSIALPTGVCLLKKRAHNEMLIFGGASFFIAASVSALLALKNAFGSIGADTLKKLGDACLAIIEKNAQFLPLEHSAVSELKNLFPAVFRAIILLSPGAVTAVGLFGVYLCIFLSRVLAGDTFKRSYPKRFAITYSRTAAIITTVSTVILVFSFYGSEMSAFSAVCGNLALLLAPTSSLIGVAHTLAGLRRPGIFSILMVILPVVMLLISPVEAILYLSFIGASCSIFRFP